MDITQQRDFDQQTKTLVSPLISALKSQPTTPVEIIKNKIEDTLQNTIADEEDQK
jgi:hypothetical protein